MSNLDEIKGDVALFNRMTKAVDFAADVMRNYDGLTQAIGEKRNQLDKLTADITETNTLLDSAKKGIEDAKQEAKDIKAEAERAAEASAVSAKGEARRIMGEAEAAAKVVKDNTEAAREALAAKTLELEDVTKKVDVAKAELRDLQESMKKSLARIGG